MKDCHKLPWITKSWCISLLVKPLEPCEIGILVWLINYQRNVSPFRHKQFRDKLQQLINRKPIKCIPINVSDWPKHIIPEPYEHNT